MIYIHPSNVNFIREIGQWKWKYDDKRHLSRRTSSIFDDAMASDALWRRGMAKPSQIKLKTFKEGI